MIKMKHFLANITQMTARVWKSGLLCLALCAMPLTGCDEWENWFDDEDEDGLISVSEALKNGMIKLTENIGEWETAVIYAEDGYILYKNDTINESQSMDYFQIQSPNADYDCAIYADKFTSIPEILILGDETYHFYNEGDSVIYVSRSTEEGTETLDSIPFTMTDETQSRASATTITYLNRDDKVQRVIKALDAILNAGTNYTSHQINKLKQALDDISMFYYYEDVENIIESLDLCRETYGETGDSVIYCFTQYATKVKVVTYDPVKYSIYVQTGWPKSVQGTSAIVRGKVSCMSNAYRDLGRWGIIYSTNRSNLSFENCEGIVYTDRADFQVRLAGLKENTTYYYKAFYKFNNSNHGDLCFKYGDRNAEYYVDRWYHSFTTKDEEVPIQIVQMEQLSAESYGPGMIKFKASVKIEKTNRQEDENLKYGLGIFKDGNLEYEYTVENPYIAKEIEFYCYFEDLTLDWENFEASTESKWTIATSVRKENDSDLHFSDEMKAINCTFKENPSITFTDAYVTGTEITNYDEDNGVTYYYTSYNFDIEVKGSFWIDYIHYHFINAENWVNYWDAQYLFGDGTYHMNGWMTYNTELTISHTDIYKIHYLNGDVKSSTNSLIVGGSHEYPTISVGYYPTTAITQKPKSTKYKGGAFFGSMEKE